MNRALTLKRFLRDKFNIDVNVRYGDTFSYDYNEDCVYYCNKHEPHTEQLFMDFCRTNGLTQDLPFKVMAFLHEVGHAMTYDEVSDDEYFVKEIFRTIHSDDDATDELNNEYFNLPDELMATLQAIDLANNFPSECFTLSTILGK